MVRFPSGDDDEGNVHRDRAARGVPENGPVRTMWRRLRRRHDAWLRARYATGRGDAIARRLSSLWSAVFAAGVLPRRWVTLEVPGRNSGLVRRFPLGVAAHDGRWYLVSMLGECAWTKNVRAAGGHAMIVRRGRHPVTLAEVPLRGPVLKAYVTQVPGGRPHIGVDHRAPAEAFESVGAVRPVFRLQGYPRRSAPSGLGSGGRIGP